MADYVTSEQYTMDEPGTFGLAEIGAWIGSSMLKEKYGVRQLEKTIPRHFAKYGFRSSILAYPPSEFTKGAGFSSYYKARGHMHMRAALKLAASRGYGVTSIAGWRAATRSRIQKQFAKIAVGKAAGIGFNVLMAGWQIELATSAVRGTIGYLRSIGRKERRLEMGTPFMGTQAAYTERQRALRAITSSRISTRAAFGNEAAMMHR